VAFAGNGSSVIARSIFRPCGPRSDRHSVRVEILLSYSKQRIGLQPGRHSSNPEFDAFFSSPKFLIAKMLRSTHESSPATPSTCTFLMANQSRLGLKSSRGTPNQPLAKFAAGSRRNCAKLSLFNLQEKFIPA
jgi:hypothetical protein